MGVSNEDFLNGMAIKGSNYGIQEVPQVLRNGVDSFLRYMYPDPQRQLAHNGHFNAFMGLLSRIAPDSAILTYNWNSQFERFVHPFPFGDAKMITAVKTPRMEAFDPQRSDMLKRDYGNADQVLLPMNYAARQTRSISANVLRTSLLSEGQLSEYIDAQIDTLTNADRIATYGYFMEAIRGAIVSGDVPNVHLHLDNPENPTAEEMQNMATLYRTYAAQLAVVPSAMYNMRHVTTVSDPSRLMTTLAPEINANMMVKVLSMAFNMEQTGIGTKMMFVDRMPQAGVYGILHDRDWYNEFRQLRAFGYMPFDPSTQSSNLTIVRKSAIGINPFVNAVMFSEAPTNIPRGSVTITPATKIVASVVDQSGAAVSTWTRRTPAPLHLQVQPADGSVDPDLAEYIVPSGHVARITSDYPGLDARTYVDAWDTIHLQPGLPKGTVLTITVTSHANDDPDGELTAEQAKLPLTTSVQITMGDAARTRKAKTNDTPAADAGKAD